MRTSPDGVSKTAPRRARCRPSNGASQSTSTPPAADAPRCRGRRRPSLRRRRSRARRRAMRRPPAAGCCSGVALPLHEERQLRILGHVVDADLPPAQVEPVRPAPVPGGGGAAESFLDQRRCPRPGPPRPASRRRPRSRSRTARPNGARSTAGWSSVRDDLQVAAVGERQDEVAGAERRVDAAVGERGAEPGAEPLHAGAEPLGPGCVGEVIQSHAAMVTYATATGDARGASVTSSRSG